MIEARIPISPTPAFLNRVLLNAASIRRYYPDTVVRAYVGQSGGPTPEAVQRVTEAFTGQKIGWEWIGQREFDQWSHTRAPYLANMNRRWKTPIDGDHVLILDADVVMVNRIDELFGPYSVQGVQAHVAPLTEPQWLYLFAIASVAAPEFSHAYSGGGIMGPPGRMGPFYPNSGFVFAPKPLFEQMIPAYQEMVNIIKGCMTDVYWIDQLALCLAAAKAKVPVKSLPLRFNFPNQEAFDLDHLNELADTRVLHYLRTDIVDRDKIFASPEAVAAFVARTDLNGSNEVLRFTVSELTNQIPWVAQ